MVLTRCWEVCGSSERVWNGFMRFERDYAGFNKILRRFEGLGGVRESSGRVPRDVFRAFWWSSKGFERFLKVLSVFRLVLKRFKGIYKVFGGSEWVWSGFRRFSEGFKRFWEDLSPFGFRAAALYADSFASTNTM